MRMPTLYGEEFIEWQRRRWREAKRRQRGDPKLTREEQERILEAQQGLCACYGDEFDEAVIPQLDHSHKTGDFRAFLCMRCNLAIGILQHERRPLWDAYLARHRGGK
jgi:hypothetical protein